MPVMTLKDELRKLLRDLAHRNARSRPLQRKDPDVTYPCIAAHRSMSDAARAVLSNLAQRSHRV